MKKLVRVKLNRTLGGNIVIAIMLLLVAAFLMLPFIYAIIQAFKPLEELFVFPPRFWVKNPTLDNFRMLVSLSGALWIPFERYLMNSVVVTVIGTFLGLLLAAFAAFPLSKYRFYGNEFLNKLIVATLLFSGPVTALPQYIIISKLGMINTYWAVILPIMGGPLYLFLMKNFMDQLPDAIIEAATIDGAGMFMIFKYIAYPMIKPAVMTSLVFAFQAFWGSNGGGYIYEEQDKLLPTMLAQMSTGSIARAGVGGATALILLIPPLIIFIISQTKIVETMAQSGIKG